MSNSQTNPKKRKMGLPSGAEGGGGGPPAGGGGMGGPSSADAARNGLVIVNKLDYELKPDLSVCVSRSNKIHHFSQTIYTAGQRMICVINSGADYIRPDRSYLEFSIKNTTTTAEMFLGQGSATNFIKDIIITSRSGDECERILDVNKLSSFLVKSCASKAQINTTGALSGFSTKSTHLVKHNENLYAHKGTADGEIYLRPKIDRTSNNGGSEYVSIKPAETLKFIIPLSMLSGIFKHDRLLPSMFMSGLRFDMLLETNQKSAMTSSNTRLNNGNVQGAKWELIRPRIICDSYQLTDSVQRVLNEEAATRGLELVFPSWHTTQFNITTADNTLQMRKAVSRALSILTLCYPLEDTANTQNRDYYANPAWDIIETQLRIGSLYFPQQSIRGNSGYETAKTCYYHMLRAASRLGCNNKSSSITFEQFAGPHIWSNTENLHLPMPGKWQNGIPVVNANSGTLEVETNALWNPATKTDTDVTVPVNGMWWDLERSNVTELTGIPINNSRVAEISFKLQTYTNNKYARDCYVYLCYVRLIRVFLQNVEVEE